MMSLKLKNNKEEAPVSLFFHEKKERINEKRTNY